MTALPLLARETGVIASTMAERRIESVFHPSDFSGASEIAFAHALKIALVSGAMLNMMHVATDSDADWGEFPGVRETLERWGLIPPGSPKSAVAGLGIELSAIFFFTMWALGGMTLVAGLALVAAFVLPRWLRTGARLG